MVQHKSPVMLISAYILATKKQDNLCLSYCQLWVQYPDSAHWVLAFTFVASPVWGIF